MKRKIPFIIRKGQCPSCMLDGRLGDGLFKCSAHGGIYPCVWTKYKWIPLTVCGSKKEDLR